MGVTHLFWVTIMFRTIMYLHPKEKLVVTSPTTDQEILEQKVVYLTTEQINEFVEAKGYLHTRLEG